MTRSRTRNASALISRIWDSGRREGLGIDLSTIQSDGNDNRVPGTVPVFQLLPVPLVPRVPEPGPVQQSELGLALEQCDDILDVKKTARSGEIVKDALDEAVVLPVIQRPAMGARQILPGLP